MEIDNPLEIRSRKELRDWLILNSETEKACWLRCPSKPGPGGPTYLDIVEEALCFGWIDGIRKASEGSMVLRISPRRKNSNWTELNKERARRLEKLGLMTDNGRKCLPDMSEGSFKLHPDVERALKEDPEVYEKYLELPELYKRVRIDTIQSYADVKDPEVYRQYFEKRLKKFMENTKQGKLYGDWHDDGRLLD